MKTNHLTKPQSPGPPCRGEDTAMKSCRGRLIARTLKALTGMLLLMLTYSAQAQNTPPTLSNPVADVGLASGFSNHIIPISSVFTDDDGDPLTVTASSDNTGVVLAVVAGPNLFLTEAGNGEAIVTLTAKDPSDATATQTFKVTVGGGNMDPVVAINVADKEYRVGFGNDTEALESLFMDEDGDALTYTVSSSDTDVVLVSITSSVLTLLEVGPGTAMVELTASDGKGGEATSTFKVSINPNKVPTVRSRVLDNTFTEGFGSSTLSFQGVFVDGDGDELTLSATSTEESVVLVEFDGLTMSIFEVGIGTATIFVDADDGFGGTTSTSFLLKVEELNEPPMLLLNIEDRSYDRGFGVATLDLSQSFSDPEDQTLSYEVTSTNADVVTPVAINDTLYLKEGGTGEARITIVAMDPAFNKLETSFTVAVVQPNQSPLVEMPLGTQTLEQGFATVAYQMNEIFSDPDGDELTYDAGSSDRQLVEASITEGVLHLKEGDGFGIATIFLSASDDRGASADISFNIIIRRASSGEVILSADHEYPEQFNIYPNPATDVLYLHPPIDQRPDKVTLIDVRGTRHPLPIQHISPLYQMDVRHLPSGLYLILLEGPDFQEQYKIWKE